MQETPFFSAKAGKIFCIHTIESAILVQMFSTAIIKRNNDATMNATPDNTVQLYMYKRTPLCTPFLGTGQDKGFSKVVLVYKFLNIDLKKQTNQ